MRISTRPPLLALGVLAALAVAAPAGAQVDPIWDHYKTYRVLNPVVGAPPVLLLDQFTQSTHDVIALEWFQNPVRKETPGQPISEIHDPRLHYTWWRITPHPWDATVLAINQFGDQTLHVMRPAYLWNPALKNEAGNPPVANHYKCYDCLGEPVNRPVFLVDQFGPWQATATFPRFFCNPVRKTNLQTGVTHPIIDDRQHYVCYDIEPPDPQLRSAIVTDQFVVNRPLELQPGRFLCVPTHKERVTANQGSTWGQLKLLYR